MNTIKRYLLIALTLNFSLAYSQSNNEYTTTVTFPPNFAVGDYIEFVRVYPGMAGAGGNYEISISYTRGNVAAAATFLASITHAGTAVWREAGKINSNPYTTHGECFVIDCNTEGANPRFRIRATNILGDASAPLPVHIKVRSINENVGWTPLNNTGNEASSIGLLPMTNEWNLYVGNSYNPESAKIALRALANGNVGIGTSSPTEKLSVNGNIRSRKVIVTQTGWPDYVFEPNYQLPSLDSVHNFIKENKHLPGMTSAATVEKEGLDLGEIVKQQQQKIEELMLYMIEMKKENEKQQNQIEELKQENTTIKKQMKK